MEDNDKLLNQNKHYKLRKIANVNILVACEKNPDEKWCYTLNEIGSILWENCDLCKDIEDLVNKIAPMFNESFTDKQKDILISFVNKLIEIGLIKE